MNSPLQGDKEEGYGLSGKRSGSVKIFLKKTKSNELLLVLIKYMNKLYKIIHRHSGSTVFYLYNLSR